MVFSSRQSVAPSLAPALPDNFADASWADIILACQTKNIPETWTVGSQKTMYINDRDYLIDIIGKAHDEYTDGSGKAPLTFQLHDCFSIKYNLNWEGVNSCGWSECTFRTSSLPYLLTLMPEEVQAAIKAVNKKTYEDSGIVTTADKLFLLSESEIFRGNTNSFTDGGIQYAYYVAGNTTKDQDNSKASKGQAWWTRSPHDSSSYHFVIVGSEGTSYTDNPTNTLGIPFAFCF